MAEDPAAVQEFFTAEETGFSARLTATIETFTDPITGSITAQTDALSESLTSLDERVGVLNEILANKRQRLIEQFARLETIISELNSQSSAIDRLASLGAAATKSSS